MLGNKNTNTADSTLLPELLILSLDFDGCLDMPQSQQRFVSYIVQLCLERPHYNKVALVIGSLRQSIALDYYNAKRHAHKTQGYKSCSALLTQLPQKLTNHLHRALGESAPLVMVIPLLHSDLYNDLPIGTTFKYMREEHYTLPEPLDLNKIKHKEIGITTWSGQDISDLSAEEFNSWHEDLLNDYCSPEELKRYLQQSWCVDYDDFITYCAMRKKMEQSNDTKQIMVTNNKGKEVILFELNQLDATRGTSIDFADTTKQSWIHNLCQYVSNNYSQTYHVLHFDDVVEILEGIESLCAKTPGYLPHNTLFQAVEWNSYSTIDPLARPLYKGYGFIYSNYAERARVVAGKMLTLEEPCDGYSSIALTQLLTQRCAENILKLFKPIQSNYSPSFYREQRETLKPTPRTLSLAELNDPIESCDTEYYSLNQHPFRVNEPT